MKDLDWSDVEADGRRMEHDEWDRVAGYLDGLKDAALRSIRYYAGIGARAENPDYHTVLVTEICDYLITGRILTTLCEGCRGRGGCDMCQPYDFSDDPLGMLYDADAHYERFGRPALPNEY